MTGASTSPHPASSRKSATAFHDLNRLLAEARQERGRIQRREILGQLPVQFGDVPTRVRRTRQLRLLNTSPIPLRADVANVIKRRSRCAPGSFQSHYQPICLSASAEVDPPIALCGDHTAVDEQIRAGDEGGVRAGQEIDRGGDVLGGTLPARR